MIKYAAAALLLLVVAPATMSLAKQEPAPAFEPTLPWLSDFDEALAASQESGKPILLEFR